MIPEPLRLELGLIKKKCDPVLRIAIEGLEEIANRDGCPHTMGNEEFNAHERISSAALDVLADVARAWRVRGETKTPYT